MTDVFPGAMVDAVASAFTARLPGVSALDDGGKAVFKRPTRPSDPAVSIGIFFLTWEPGESEMVGQANFGPTLATYNFAIQAFVKNAGEADGQAAYSSITKQVRSMLYRDTDLRLALASLVDTSVGKERVQRWGVRSQRGANNEINGSFLFLSTTDFFIETESTL